MSLFCLSKILNYCKNQNNTWWFLLQFPQSLDMVILFCCCLFYPFSWWHLSTRKIILLEFCHKDGSVFIYFVFFRQVRIIDKMCEIDYGSLIICMGYMGKRLQRRLFVYFKILCREFFKKYPKWSTIWGRARSKGDFTKESWLQRYKNHLSLSVNCRSNTIWPSRPWKYTT